MATRNACLRPGQTLLRSEKREFVNPEFRQFPGKISLTGTTVKQQEAGDVYGTAVSLLDLDRCDANVDRRVLDTKHYSFFISLIGPLPSSAVMTFPLTVNRSSIQFGEK